MQRSLWLSRLNLRVIFDLGVVLTALRSILNNKGRFTAVEYGIMACLIVVYAEQMILKI